MLALTGVLSVLFNATNNTLLQVEAREDIRGRVLSLYTFLMIGSTPVGAAFTGFVADTRDIRVALTVNATICLAGLAYCHVVPVSCAAQGRAQHMRVAIVGGGIGGVAAANALLQKGIEVGVYEQAPQLKEVGAGVAIHPNGVRMLRRLGFGEELLRYGARWTDPQFRHPDGRLIAPFWPPARPSASSCTACTAPTCCRCCWTGCRRKSFTPGIGASASSRARTRRSSSSTMARGSARTWWSARTASTPRSSST